MRDTGPPETAPCRLQPFREIGAKPSGTVGSRCVGEIGRTNNEWASKDCRLLRPQYRRFGLRVDIDAVSDIYPDTLLDSPPPDARWWAAYTFACREKVFMQRLQKFKVPFYGPLIKRTTRTPSGRPRPGFVPLFPGYVFLCGNEEQRAEAFKTKCAVRIIEAPDKAELLFDLRQIRQLIASDAPLTPEARLSKGMKVRIRSGPLSGIKGSVIKRHGKDTLLVAVNFLQQGASVVLDDYEMEKIG